MDVTGRLYKVLRLDGRPHHGGRGVWQLPYGDEPGPWMPTIRGRLIPCQRGYHLARPQDLLEWLGPVIYEAEYDPKHGRTLSRRVDGDNKIVVRRARLIRRLDTWNDRTARLFACDCADRAIARLPDPDHRLVSIVNVARGIVEGRAERDDINAAVRAAWSAASAGWAAARDAPWQTAMGAAGNAAMAAAMEAPWAAAGSAAWAAAGNGADWAAAGVVDRDTERRWQISRLFEYLYPGTVAS